MKRWGVWILLLLCLTGCGVIRPQQGQSGASPIYGKNQAEDGREEENSKNKTEDGELVGGEEGNAEGLEGLEGLENLEEENGKRREPVKVKGIYLTAGIAGSKEPLDIILQNVAETEINAVVIDVKDDNGRITFDMDTPMVNEIDACQVYIEDIDALMTRLKDMGVYTIARVVAFRDPYLAEKKPEWSLHDSDGSVHRDSSGLAWVNPYKTEVWDYLVEVGKEAGRVGFDEVQFDYIRFATDKTMRQVVFDEADTKGRTKTDVITEFMEYAYEHLSEAGLFVSADVFGTIIGSAVDARAVGQIYEDMAEHLDYICPMIYPSHYGDGNFGLDHPDLHPYETILGALQISDRVLKAALRGEKTIVEADEELEKEKSGQNDDTEIHMDEVQEASLNGKRPHVLAAEIKEEVLAKEEAKRTMQQEKGTSEYHQARVRPWLQDFTASYLKHYKKYGPEEIREQIQAVYDAGYEEWILWNAANQYTWDGLEKDTNTEE